MRINGFKGFLFIGDPHLCGYNPGKRLDDYQNAILDKLEQAAAIATEQKLVPVMLGDLFHRPNENSLRLFSRLTDISRRFPILPQTLEGNHDKVETRLTEADALALMHKTGVVNVITQAGLVNEYDFEGQVVRLYAVPYGAEIPAELPEEEGVVNIIITHHELNFSGAHVGCKPLSVIKGCKMLVNGHLHKTLPSFTCGETRAHNPGNIARLTLDVRDAVPSVWSWLPSSGDYELTRHPLRYVAEVFNLTGEHVEAAKPKASVKVLEKSHFAELLAGQTKQDGERSDDATSTREDMKACFEELETSEAAQLLLKNLLRETVKVLKDSEAPAN